MTGSQLVASSRSLKRSGARSQKTTTSRGTANQARGLAAGNHQPRFDIDEDALPVGVVLLTLAWRPSRTYWGAGESVLVCRSGRVGASTGDGCGAVRPR
jgi:hypothetical protein